MRRAEFIKLLKEAGCILLRHGSKHDIYINPAIGKKQPVPRHAEIDDALVRHIMKYLKIKFIWR